MQSPFFENHHLAMLLIDPADGSIVDANPAAEEFYGWTREELRQKRIQEINVLSPEAIRREMDRARALDRRHFEFQHRLRDGRIRDVNVFSGPIRVNDRELLYSVVHDVTEHRESERLLRAIVDSSPLAIVTLDFEDRVTSWNPAAMRLMGWTAEEVLGRRAPFIPPDQREQFEGLRERMRESGGSAELEGMRCRKDGSLFPARVHISSLLDSSGKVRGRMGFIIDLSSQSEAREHLELQAAALDAAANVIVITDRDGIIQWANRAFETATGYLRTEALGRTPGQLLKSGKQSPDFYRELWNTILAGEVWRGELTNRRKDGTTYVEELAITPIGGAKGEITHFVAVKQDITAKRSSEARIHLLSKMTEAIPHPMAFANREFRYEAVNRAYAKLYGLEPERLMGCTIASIIGEAEFEKVIRPRFEQALLGHEMTFESEVLDAEGKKVTLVRNYYPFVDQDGAVGGVVLHALDVTEERRLSEHVTRVQRLESLGMLASGIAHDLNNILAPILMSADLLHDLVEDPIHKDILDTVKTAARRGGDIVGQILAFARGSESGKSQVDLRRVVGEVRRTLLETFPKTITVECDLTPETCLVTGDATQLQQVLMNLCLNARDAMPSGGRLTIGLHPRKFDVSHPPPVPELPHGNYLCLMVKDTGQGLTDEAKIHLFDPFFTTKAVGKGTGLGLPISLGIVRGLGGAITFESQRGFGTQFDVLIPRLISVSASPFPAADHRVNRGNGERILVIDDELAIREVTRQALESYGYEVTVAANGAQALVKVGADPSSVDLVIADIRMPVMGGIHAIRALRLLRPELPVIVVTGQADQRETEEVDQIGVQGFLHKPFPMGELMEAIRLAFASVKQSGDGP